MSEQQSVVERGAESHLALSFLRPFLERCRSNQELHARFVNTLSYLEYIGARKIMKSQRAETMTQEVLSHASEEIRHAHVFKRAALELSRGRLKSYSEGELLAGKAATAYFQDLDRGIAQDLGESDTWRNYLYTTLLIEERANEFYPIYEPVLVAAGFPHLLRTILKEEERHMDEMTGILATIPGHSLRLPRLRALEESLFAEFVSALIQAESQFKASEEAFQRLD